MSIVAKMTGIRGRPRRRERRVLREEIRDEDLAAGAVGHRMRRVSRSETILRDAFARRPL